MGPDVSLALGPPARLAMMIWSTLSTVQAALVAYLSAHFLANNRSRTPDSLQSYKIKKIQSFRAYGWWEKYADKEEPVKL